MILRTLHASTPQGNVPQSLFAQGITYLPICVPLPMTSTSHVVFLHECKISPTTSTSCVVILHGHEPLPTNYVSRVGLLHELEPPQVTFDSRVGVCLALFILRGPSMHRVETAFVEYHQI
jgi:hypothetical protein